ncbi:MAG: hypothetical protein HUK19_00935 [Fibrobacter sp.]|nr:hypothetical protein [Fibrobacter sp.]
MNLTLRTKLLIAGLVLTLAGVSSGARQGPWKFELGMGTRSLTPLVLVGGVSYKNLGFKLQGLGFHNGPRDYWCGARGSLLWTFFDDLPFQVSLGIGTGYEFAQAPNDLYRAINIANGAKYLVPYNFKEDFDVSGEIWTSVYGFYTQISVPVYQMNRNLSNELLWGVGYIYRF